MTIEKYHLRITLETEEKSLAMRENFVNHLKYFEGSLEEYEKVKGKKYQIIDLGKDLPKRIYSKSILFWNGDLRKEQNNLVDKLIEEDCVGVVNGLAVQRFLFKSQRYIEGDFVKEKKD